MQIDFLEHLENKKNLLAFSHGTDSTALFYALLNRCSFDLCLVNYHTRNSSDAEELAAKNLAKKYNKKIFINHARLEASNFESRARQFRYEFFDACMNEYDNLLLAHNLNDRFEWFLMQFAKGAGLCNLLGFSGIDKRKNYQIIRPLINVCKDEIMRFLRENNYEYFQDESNFDKKYKRNEIRLNYANDFIKNYAKGTLKSLNYLEKDAKALQGELGFFKGIYICSNENAIDKAIKKLGEISSAKQKEQMQKELKAKGEAQIYFGRISLCVSAFKGYFLVFKKCDCKLEKELKNSFRLAKIPQQLRFFLAKNKINTEELLKRLKQDFLNTFVF